MPNTVLDDEDELLDDEQRKTIGKPLVYGPPEPPAVKAENSPMQRPNPSSTQVPAAMPAPEGGASPTPDASTIAGIAPFSQPDRALAAPRPAQQALSDWQSSDLAKHPAQQPRYHGIARVADTIARLTWPGQLAEEGGEFGTLGAEAKQERLARGAQLENEQIAEGQKERLGNAQQEEEQAKAEGERKGSELVDVKLPDGSTTQVLRKNLGSPTAAIISGASRENVADTNKERAENVAGINAGAREETARIMVGGKPMATKNIVGADGTPHVMMWNPNTHTYDRDLGKAPPPASASSAFAATRTVQLIDPESGLPTVFQFDPATQTYSKQVGTSATGAYGHEIAQAGAVERAGTQLITDIKAHSADLGNLQAWVEKYGLNTPIADPELAKLQAELATFAALQPAMHGFRARSAMESFENIIGGLQKNPEATIASIQGILQTAGNIRGTASPVGNPGGQGGRAPAANAQGGPANPTGPRVQQNSKGEYRYSTDGGNTWHPGKPPQ